ncbi:MAG: cadherin repeat domain-containing protein, partial [Epsilonproteobacteria bacterium]
TDVNEAPTDIALSSNTVAENSATGTAIGTLSNTDVDTGNTYTYSLVSGAGDTDNALVSISGTSLKVAGAIDFETNPTLEIRVNVNDGANNFFEAMVVNVTDVNTAPTGIALSNSDVDEEVAVGTVVGTLSATDDGEDGTLSYSFDGGTDDVSFTIDGTSLKTDSSFDFETKASYSIDIKVNDGGATEFTKTFTITINDTVEDPTITMCSSTQTYGTVTNATTGKNVAR